MLALISCAYTIPSKFRRVTLTENQLARVLGLIVKALQNLQGRKHFDQAGVFTKVFDD